MPVFSFVIIQIIQRVLGFFCQTFHLHTAYSMIHCICWYSCLAMLAAWLKGRSTTLVQTEIAWQLLDGLPWSLVEVPRDPRRTKPTNFEDLLIFHFAPAAGQSWTDIHGSQTMYLNDFGDPLTFPLAPSCGSHLSGKSQQLIDWLP